MGLPWWFGGFGSVVRVRRQEVTERINTLQVRKPIIKTIRCLHVLIEPM